MPPETEYKKGVQEAKPHNSVRGVLPRVVATSSIRKQNCLKLHTTFSDTQLTQRVATINVNPSTVQHSTMIATRAYLSACLASLQRRD